MMKWIVIILCAPAAVLLGAFAVMVIRGMIHPYRPTRQEIRQTLLRVLEGTMTWPEWDDFTHIPLKHDSLLEQIRIDCEAMENGDFVHRDDSEMEQKWVYNDKGLERVRELVKRLDEEGEQTGGGQL